MLTTIVAQRKDADCGVTALSSYLHIAYEDVYVAAVAVQPNVSKCGLYAREVLDIADLLGRPLKIKRRPNLDSDSGILGINYVNAKGKIKGDGHWVVLIDGKLLDGQPPQLWDDAEEYLATQRARAGWLLTEDE